MKKWFRKIKDKFSIHLITSFKKQKKDKKIKHLTKREKILKYTAIVLFPTLAVTSGVILGFKEYNKNNGNITNEVEVSTEGIKRKIFLVSKDNYTVPLTINMKQRTTLQQEILDVFDLLKTSSKANSSYVNGFINDETKVLSFKLENKILELNLSKEFLDSSLNDVNIVEALTLTFLQFEEIDELKLFVDGEVLTSYNNIPLPSSLYYNFGINQEVLNIKEMKGKEKVVIFGKRTYDQNNEYLIPVTVFVEAKDSFNETFVNAVNKSFSSSSLLKKVSLYEGLSKEQNPNEEFVFNVNSKALSDEDYVKKDLFDLVSMSLEFMNKEEMVSFTLEGESIQVDGVYELESYSVSSVIINEVEL